ncbi:MAG: DUF4402 domain-containing protein [Thermoanaerobaculia bacterium]
MMRSQIERAGRGGATIAAIALVCLLSAGLAEAAVAYMAVQPSAISITNDSALNFGSFIVGPSAGTVTVAPDGTRTVSGVIPIATGSFNAASFTVTVSGSGNPHYLITIPAGLTLTGPGGATMSVDTFLSNPAISGIASPPARQDTLAIGATLRINANQQSGAYNGVFPVTVNLGN